MIVITYVLLRLFKNIFNEYALSNIFLSLSFVIIWIIVFFMLGFLGGKTSLPYILVIGLGLDGAYILSFIQFWTENYVPFDIFNAGVTETEIPASWFSVLNSLFIILLAPVFSLVWASKLNPSGPIKFSIGLILLGLGFGFLFYGSLSIPLGAETAAVSVIWLIIAYFFHTLGELCVSPVGLSYVSKLAPVRLIGLMFGFWLLSSAVANFLGGVTGSYIDLINDYFGIAGFFLLFAIIPIGAGIVMFLINKILVKKMHGIK
jgi:POT family proton-dependent oligopeptide transporter